MLFGVRNWIEEPGVTAAYTGTAYPSASVLSSAHEGTVFRGQTAATLTFALGAARIMHGLAITGLATTSHPTTLIGYTVRNGGAGGAIVASGSMGFGAAIDGLNSTGANFGGAVTGDYIALDLSALAAPLDIRRVWAGRFITTTAYTPTLEWIDPSTFQQARNGASESTETPLRRRFTAVIRGVQDRLSLGLSAADGDLADWQDMLSLAGTNPVCLHSMSELYFPDLFIGRMLSGKLRHDSGANWFVDLVVGDVP